MTGIVRMTHELLTFAADNGVPEAVQNVLAIVMEEILTNTMKYGYAEDRPGEVAIEAAISAASITLTIADDADPFDPLQAQAPKLKVPIDKRDIGGLGLHLVRSLTDSLSYAHIDGRNVLTVTKRYSC